MAEISDEAVATSDRKKANFRRNAYYYLGFNLFTWALWWFTTGHITGFTGYPWPVWLMLGWGVALIKQYVQAYHSKPKL